VKSNKTAIENYKLLDVHGKSARQGTKDFLKEEKMSMTVLN
jgi:hypothetical protein